MKVLVTLAVLCFLQSIAGQVVKNETKPHHPIVHEAHENKQKNPAHAQDHVKPPNQNSNNEQQADTKKPEVLQQHVAVHLKPTDKVQHSSQNSNDKISVDIPPKVQQVVTQVSQHIPHIVEQHVANKQRVVRAVRHHLAWQAMQINPKDEPGKCEFICNPLDVTVCGYNGRCYWEFESHCDLSIYNCLNTEKIFQTVDFAKCKDEGGAKCYRGDM